MRTELARRTCKGTSGEGNRKRDGGARKREEKEIYSDAKYSRALMQDQSYDALRTPGRRGECRRRSRPEPWDERMLLAGAGTRRGELEWD